MRKELFAKLEKEILARRPRLAKALQPGLTEDQIRDILNRAKASNHIDALVGLYSWKNGAAETPESFFPESIYQFLPLEAAVEHHANLQQAAHALAAMGSPVRISKEEGRYFPVFWDGVTGYLAIDLKHGMGNRVMEVEFESETPFRKVCGSFEEFLVEATRAIQEDEPLDASQQVD